MFGAILGDIVGSPYEFDSNNIKVKDFPLFTERSHFTDDTVMTLAVAKGFSDTVDWTDEAALKHNIISAMRELGRAYPNAGYGGRFGTWLKAEDPQPYGSWGNGSAMRVSAVAWMFDTLEEVRLAAQLSAEVTHNHPEGIKGAEATASAIFLARTGYSKAKIRQYVETKFGYDFSRTCDEIRPGYRHVESCQETVPEAITAFLEGKSFEDVLRTAISLGGDSDTLAAIAGSIAEGYYGIDEDWKKAALSRLPEDLSQILRRFDVEYGVFPAYELNPVHQAIRFAEQAHRGQKRKGTDVDYITHPLEVLQILTSVSAGQELLMAGVLHDTVEDTEVTLEDIQEKFGDRVAALVGNHSEDKSKSWKERKQHTINELKQADRDTKLLIMADKVSNLRSMLADYAIVGDKLWERFNAPKELQSWYNSEVQDALYDLQFDEDARLVYWELVALYKDLFVEYRLNQETQTLYQIPCGYPAHAFAWGGDWEEFVGDVSAAAVKLPRLKAERLEDRWRWDSRDRTLDGNERIEAAINAFYVEDTQERLDAILQTIRNRIAEDGHFVLPVEQLSDIDDGGEIVERFQPQTITMKDETVVGAAFTSQEAMRKAPKTAVLSHFIDSVLSAVLENKELDGLVLNPWGNSLFLNKPLIGMLLDRPAPLETPNSITVERGDITELHVECIVNAANNSLLGGGGVDGAIHRTAGPELLNECRSLHGCKTGQAKITGGYKLPAKYVIHTVGPVYSGTEEDVRLLASCYLNSLDLAKENGIHSIAFPSISTGAYGYPMVEAADIAIRAVQSWLQKHLDYGMEITFVCYSKSAFNIYHDLYMKTLD